jgi:outer membrane protein assembly factor BamA
MRYLSCMRFFRTWPLFAAAVCLCAFAGTLFAQTRMLREIKFTGAPTYSQAELLAFIGLKPGSSATQQQIEDAAQRLGDTGLFEEVNFSGNDQGIVYTLKPAAASTMLPVRFGNFVWWRDEEIQQTLKVRVPLYRADAVPTAGNLRDSIAVALTAMLAEKGVAGAQVGSRLGSGRPGGPLDHVVFAIDSPAVIIHSLRLVDASPGMQPKLERVIRDVSGQQWDTDASYPNIESRVCDVYRDEGYLDIAVVKQEHSAPVIAAENIGLDVTAMLSEGAQYHVAQLAWPGSDMLSAADFKKQATLKVGDPASPTALRESLHLLTNAYGAKGYLDAKVLAPPAIDRAAHQVAYSISVEPGPQYHFRSVMWPSVSEAQAKAFDAAWKLKPGDVYDSSYPVKFLEENAMLRSQGYRMSVVLRQNRSALTVDLSITFTKGGSTPPE